MTKHLLFIGLLFSTTQLFADALFPLASARPQQDGNCWAYGASHMLEAKVQQRDGLSVMTNVEKSYRYWLLYDRLLNSYHRKALDEGDGGGEGINDIGAFAADLFHIYEHHGLEWIKVVPDSKTSELEYPQSISFPNRFQSNPNSEGLINPLAIKKVEQRLIQENLSETEALKLIQKTLAEAFKIQDPLLDQTAGYNSVVPVADTFSTLIGTNFNSFQKMILLSSTLSQLPDGQWFRYDSGRFQAISYKKPKDILAIVRASLDRGWPTTFETIDHVMTAVGYKTLGSSYVYAVSDSSGAYMKRGISWVTEEKALKFFTDATVNLDAVSDLLPQPPLMQELLPSKHLPRKH